ncbi:hypothetical protein YC2023_083786 [Brassica napus]
MRTKIIWRLKLQRVSFSDKASNPTLHGRVQLGSIIGFLKQLLRAKGLIHLSSSGLGLLSYSISPSHLPPSSFSMSKEGSLSKKKEVKKVVLNFEQFVYRFSDLHLNGYKQAYLGLIKILGSHVCPFVPLSSKSRT